MDRVLNVVLKSYLALFFAFIFAPIVVLVLFAFNDSRFPSLPWSGFTLRWFEEVLSDPAVRDAASNSIVVALTVAAIATPIGAMAAYFVSRWDFKGEGAYLGIVAAPPLLPLLVLALAFSVFFREAGFAASLTTVTIAHVVLAAPFALGIMRMRISEMNVDTEQAAWNLGAGRWRTIATVVLPQAIPALAAAYLLSAAISWDEAVIAWYVSGMDVTLPVHVWSEFSAKISTAVNAIGALSFAASISMIVVAEILFFGLGKRRKHEQ